MQWPDDVIVECTITYEQNLHGPSSAWNLFAVEQIGGTVGLPHVFFFSQSKSVSVKLCHCLVSV